MFFRLESVTGGFLSAEQEARVLGQVWEPLSARPAPQEAGQQQRPALLHAPSLRDGADAVQLVAGACYGVGDEVAFLVQDADFDGANRSMGRLRMASRWCSSS